MAGDPLASGIALLAERIAELDHPLRPSLSLAEELLHFILVLSAANATVTRLVRPVVSPGDADDLVNSSVLLKTIGAEAPSLVVGPMGETQYWMGTGKGKGVARDRSLHEGALIPMERQTHTVPDTTPRNVGLFTSSAIGGTFGMWHMYVRNNLEPFVRPWYTWKVVPQRSLKVLDLTSATKWVEFVASHSVVHDGMLYPDWKAVARHYDAIHMTLTAITATQGVYLRTDQGMVAPPYWDVESTFWFRWCFEAAVELVEVLE